MEDIQDTQYQLFSVDIIVDNLWLSKEIHMVWHCPWYISHDTVLACDNRLWIHNRQYIIMCNPKQNIWSISVSWQQSLSNRYVVIHDKYRWANSISASSSGGSKLGSSLTRARILSSTCPLPSSGSPWIRIDPRRPNALSHPTYHPAFRTSAVDGWQQPPSQEAVLVELGSHSQSPWQHRWSDQTRAQKCSEAFSEATASSPNSPRRWILKVSPSIFTSCSDAEAGCFAFSAFSVL